MKTEREFEGLSLPPTPVPPVRGGAAYRVRPKRTAAAEGQTPDAMGGRPQIPLALVGFAGSPDAVR